MFSIPRTVWALGFVSLLMDVSSEMVLTLLPMYLVGTLGVSTVLLGLIEGGAVALATISKFVAGVVADRFGRNKPMAVLGYGLAALSRLLFPLAIGAGQIAFARGVDRVGKGIRATARDGLIAAAAPPDLRGASFGLRKSLDTVGGFAGPLIAVGLMLLLAGNIRAVFWCAVLPAALAMLVLMFGVSEDATEHPQSKTPPALRDMLRLPRAYWQVVAVASAVTLAQFSQAFVLLKSLDAGFAPTWVPLAMVVMHAVFGLTAYPVGRLSDRVGRHMLLRVGLGFLVVAHLVLAQAASVPVFVLGTVFWGLHMGFSAGLLSTMVVDTAPRDRRGTAFGAFNLITGVLVLVGNLLCGWLWQAYGSAVPFYVGAGLTCAAIISLSALRR